MAKEHFFYRETEPLSKKLELLSRRSGVSRGPAFICGNSLSGQMQSAYRIGHFITKAPTVADEASFVMFLPRKPPSR